jgi:HPt (histidine-containing phosphotransfer) domain-containing protein
MQAKLSQNDSREPLVERQRLLERCLGKQELADRLVGILVNGLPKDSVEIQTALETGDLPRVAAVSHRLKGAAANMCAPTLSSAAAALEQAARTSDVERVPDSWLMLQQQIELVLEELRR